MDDAQGIGSPPGETPAAPRFVGGKPRSQTVELEFPIEYGGKVYSSLTVLRVSADRIATWVDAIRQKDPDADLGNVVDDEGKPVPNAVLEFLDPDDDEVVSKVITDFLPRRLRGAFDSTLAKSTSSSSSARRSSTPQSPGSSASSGPASSDSP